VPKEPQVKRAVAFIDGQNLFHAAREAFGYSYPNYDPGRLAESVCTKAGWSLTQVRFYTGVPDSGDNPRWHQFWAKKLAVMGTRNMWTFKRPLRYRHETVTLPDGKEIPVLVGREKGIDVRLALDVIRLTLEGVLDVALVFSQDQDLSEVADEVRYVSVKQSRWLKVASAFPQSAASKNRRGINGTQWMPIDRALYDACLDPNDYR
jgi:uncharacterized LabA/DUF88 family protein